MKIKYFCSWWGLDHLGYEQMLRKVSEAGFDGIEIGIPTKSEDQQHLRELLIRYNLDVIAHQYQANGDFIVYKSSFKKSLENAAKFRPLLVNSHSGKDYWDVKNNLELLKISDEIENNYGVTIAHETHRKHFLFSTFTAKEFFNHKPKLKITADFSHWTCVSETLLEDQQEILQEAILRTKHIHARVGYEQGPQIPDPRAPEWEKYLLIFTFWWQCIVNVNNKLNKEFITITPEFGPFPYTLNLPFTQKPISDFFEINCWMKDYLKNTIKLSI